VVGEPESPMNHGPKSNPTALGNDNKSKAIGDSQRQGYCWGFTPNINKAHDFADCQILCGGRASDPSFLCAPSSLFLSFFLSWVVNTQLNHWTDWFWVLICYAATQLALQLHQERKQVVRSNRVTRKRPARGHCPNGHWS